MLVCKSNQASVGYTYLFQLLGECAQVVYISLLLGYTPSVFGPVALRLWVYISVNHSQLWYITTEQHLHPHTYSTSSSQISINHFYSNDDS